jgi:methionyl-tRNA synthetase
MAFYITTPIYYVNAAPHLGHAYSTIGADILARHMRQRGEDVFFLTGTDEHGEPVAEAAEALGVTPQELADTNARRFQDLMPADQRVQRLLQSDDRSGAQQRACRRSLQRVHDNGTLPGAPTGLVLPALRGTSRLEQEIARRHLLIHLIPLSARRGELVLSGCRRSRSRSSACYRAQPDIVTAAVAVQRGAVVHPAGHNDVLAQPLAATVGASEVPVGPGARLLRLVRRAAQLLHGAVLREPGEDLTGPVLARDVPHPRQGHPEVPRRVLARAPAGAELPVPRHLFIHGYLLMDGEKMSKSLGNVLDPFVVMDTFGTDALRFYCFREVAFGSDGSVSTAGFESRYESELANEYGNLASRTLAMINRYRDGAIPDVEVDPALAPDFDGLAEEVCALLDGAELTQALDRIWQRVRRLNRYVEEQAPWVMAKDEAGRRLDTALRSLPRGWRSSPCCCTPTCPDRQHALHAASGRATTPPGCDAWRAAVRRPPGGDASRSSRRCSPR